MAFISFAIFSTMLLTLAMRNKTLSLIKHISSPFFVCQNLCTISFLVFISLSNIFRSTDISKAVENKSETLLVDTVQNFV